MRVGIGYDVHPLTSGRRLVLGGVDITLVLFYNPSSEFKYENR